MTPRARGGFVAAAIVAALAALPLAALAWRAGAAPDLRLWNDAYLMRVLRFSLLQAGLSMILSVAPAILVARALARRSTL
ncbi:MAG: hypothetical protein DWQ08_12145, partial [Proteobacteria bacterium]